MPLENTLLNKDCLITQKLSVKHFFVAVGHECCMCVLCKVESDMFLPVSVPEPVTSDTRHYPSLPYALGTASH